MRQFLLICLEHSNSIEIDVTLQPQLSMEGTTARLHPSGSNCCAFSTSISHTSTFVEEGPRPYIWMLKEIGKLVIPTSFQWGLPQSSNLANLSALMIMMGLLQGEVWSRHRGVSSLGWRICEVSNVQWSRKLESPIPWPPLCILHYKILSSKTWCTTSFGPWSVKPTLFLGSLELTLFHVSEPFQKRFFKAIRNSLGSTQWSFCPPENRSDGLVETDTSDNSQSEHSRLYLPLFKIRIMRVSRFYWNTRVHNCFRGLNPWIRHYMRFLATKPLFSLKMVVYIRASPQKT